MEGKGDDMSGKSWRIFSLFGIDVKIHSSLMFVLVFFSWSFSSQFTQTLNTDYPGLFSNASFTGWILGITTALMLFVSVLKHEFGHALVAKAFGMRVVGITLFMLGGVSNIDELDKAPPLKSFFITAAGPFVNIVLVVLFWGVYQLFDSTNPTQISVFVFKVVLYLGAINFVLAVFNLIPAFPLDGGRIFLALLQIFGVEKNRARDIAGSLGVVICCAIILAGGAGVIGVLPLSVFGGFWWILIGAFLLTANMAERRKP